MCLKGSTQGLSVSLSLLKVPVAGENITFTVMVTNMDSIPKVLREHVNAQTKEYNRCPSDTFWEVHNVIRIAPHEGRNLNASLTLIFAHNVLWLAP